MNLHNNIIKHAGASCFSSLKGAFKKHSPEILIGIGIVGMISSTVLAVKATPKAIKLIEEKKGEKETEKLSPIETFKTAWVCYVPSAVTCAISVACLISANSLHFKRNAALATAYTFSERAFREYRDKVVEVVGEKKEQDVKDAVAKSEITKNPVSTREIVITEHGNTLCYDVLSGRYFKSDIEKLRKAENELNQRMLGESYVSLNDFYYEIGLKEIKIGDQLGWDINEEGFISLEFSSQLAEDGTPCLVLGHHIAPQYAYH